MTEVVDQHIAVNDPGPDGADADASPFSSILSELVAFTDSTDKSLEATIREKAESPLRDVLDAALEKSRAALEQYEVASREVESRRDAWQAIVDYRGSVAENVVTPISRFLRDGQPGAALAEAFQDAFSAMSERGDSVVESLELEESGEALKPRPGDGSLRLARKAIARKFYRAKPIPVRTLARYHLQVRLARALSRRREESQEQLSRSLVLLETAVSTWSHSVLDLEQDLDRFRAQQWTKDEIEIDSNGQESGADDQQSPTSQEIRAEIIEVGKSLSDSLNEAIANSETLYKRFGQKELDRLHSFFDYDLRAYGTFLLREREREIPDSEWLPAALATQSDNAWIEYQEESRNRIRLNQHLLRTRATIIKLLNAILDQVHTATVVPLSDICSKLVRGIEAEMAAAEKAFEETADNSDHKELAQRLVKIGEKASGASQVITNDFGGINAADAALRELGRSEWERSRRDVDQLPSRSQIHAIDPTGEPRPALDAPRSSVNMRQIVNEVLAIRFSEQLRKPAKQLRRVVARRWGDVLMVAETVSFNARAAAEKLTEDSSDDSVGEAKKIVTDGLNRALERTRDASRALEAPWADFQTTAVKVVMNVWTLIHRRMRSAELEPDQWADLGSRLSIASQSYQLKLADAWQKALKKLGIWWRLIRLKAGALIRKGQSAVGVSTSKPSAITATIDAIRNFERVDENMPFIYHRLFTLQALDDATFLEGRAADVQAVRSHFDRWKNGYQPSVLLISSKLGNGRTSFLNTLEDLVFDEARVCSVHFQDRCRSEEEVADAIAGALDISLDGSPSFDALRRVLTKRTRRDEPLVCRFYELEHLVLSVPGGARLISELLVFLAATDQYVYWIGGVSELCRQFIERTSITSGLATFHDLTPLSPDELEALILNRHRRSGIEITFKPPESISTLTRQRLNRTASEEDKQEILAEIFFDQLSRFAEQDLRLALFGWLQSVEFDEKGDSALVGWRLDLDFGFLSSLDRQRAFSLRSFLFHKTLTVEEHAEIFRMNLDMSILVLESLLNTGLLTTSRNKQDPPTQIEVGERYRIHPLMQGPVRHQLVGRHMVY